MRSKGPRLLLITGVPGSGKTSIADHLRDNHGFEHFDVEKTHTLPLPEQVDVWKKSNADVVVSWGFMPGVNDHQVRWLQQQGFTMVWLDGDRAVARKFWLAREAKSAKPIPVQYLNVQMEKIRSMDLKAFKPVIQDPYDAEGAFKDAKDRSAALLALFPQEKDHASG